MCVVGSLELVDIADDHSQRRVVPLAARDLRDQPLFAVTPVREPGQLVGDRLPGCRLVQARVLESVCPLCDEGPAGDQRVLAQLVGVQDQDPEARVGGRNR